MSMSRGDVEDEVERGRYRNPFSKKAPSIRSVQTVAPSLLSRFMIARRRRSLSTGEVKVVDDRGRRRGRVQGDDDERRRSRSMAVQVLNGMTVPVLSSLDEVKRSGRSLGRGHRFSVASVTSVASSGSSLRVPESDDEEGRKEGRRWGTGSVSSRGTDVVEKGRSRSRSVSSSFVGETVMSRESVKSPDESLRRKPTVRPVTALAALFLWLLEVGAFEGYEYYIPRMAAAQKIATDLVTAAGPTSTPLSAPTSVIPTSTLKKNSKNTPSSPFQMAQNLFSMTLGKRRQQVVDIVGVPECTPLGTSMEAGAAVVRAAKVDPRHGQLGILGYLVLPFQRLTRYAIMFDRLLTTLAPEDEEALELLTLLTQRLRKTVETCNDLAREKNLSYTLKPRRLSQDRFTPSTTSHSATDSLLFGPDPTEPQRRPLPTVPTISTSPSLDDDPERTPRRKPLADTTWTLPAVTDPMDDTASLTDSLTSTESVPAPFSFSSPTSTTSFSSSSDHTLGIPSTVPLLKRDGILTLLSNRTHDAVLESWNSPSEDPDQASVALYSDGRFVVAPFRGAVSVVRVSAGGATLVAGRFEGRRRVRVVGGREEGGKEMTKGGVFPLVFPTGKRRRKGRREEYGDVWEIVLEGEEKEVVEWWKAINGAEA
ncbi:hypothetical protein BC829DRAFT_405320 [Chytridium lagenaria]|nr:hypothetical protein BC829DRAFT_405320 [Chytridium lagenaria]